MQVNAGPALQLVVEKDVGVVGAGAAGSSQRTLLSPNRTFWPRRPWFGLLPSRIVTKLIWSGESASTGMLAECMRSCGPG